MNKEIDLRVLLVNNLKCTTHDISPYTIYTNNEDNIIKRPLETFRKWSRIEQTSYIESIFLHCSLQPIIRFVNTDHTIILDGENRYNAIIDFCNNKLVLQEKGLKQLKFLANKNFEKLTKAEQDYFKKCDPIKFFDYEYNKNDKFLTEAEEYKIIRYLHLIYNIGLRLDVEEMQKAQFSSDFITNKIREELTLNPDFLNKLEKLKLFNGRKKRNKIDNILLNCRLLIASTYSNIYQFSSTKNIQNRIEDNYLPNIKNIDYNKIYQDFNLNINLIYNNLICTQKWEVYKQLHTKPFIDVTYWLVSIIRKDNLGNPLSFDFMKYLEYFGESEERSKYFEIYQSHYKVNIINRYKVVAEYYKNVYGYDTSSYFEEDSLKNENIGIINNIEELYQSHFSFVTSTIKVSDLIDNLKNTNYNLRPHYQREETMNAAMASKLIESILLGLKIPYLLLYNRFEKEGAITEVVDGQQRILSLLGFLQRPFNNINSELEYSNKNGYALKELKILSELNGLKYPINYEPNNKINKNKILNTELYISTTSDVKDSGFNAIDHFIRLNKNVFTIKDNTYRMWSLSADREIIDYEKNITQYFYDKILPKSNQKRTANMVTLKLACLFFHQNIKDINKYDYTNKKITLWLNDFYIKKSKLSIDEEQKIDIIRKEYLKSLDKTRNFYYKIDNFLNKINSSIRDLFNLNKYANQPVMYYYYLFTMLSNISEEDLLKNCNDINKYLTSFFVKVKTLKINQEEINQLLEYTTKQIDIFDNNKRIEFKEKIEQIINN